MASHQGSSFYAEESSSPVKADPSVPDMPRLLLSSHAGLHSNKRKFSELSPNQLNYGVLHRRKNNGEIENLIHQRSPLWDSQYSHHDDEPRSSEHDNKQPQQQPPFSLDVGEHLKDRSSSLNARRLMNPRSFSNPPCLSNPPSYSNPPSSEKMSPSRRQRRPLTKLSVADTIKQAQAETNRSLQIRCEKQNDMIWSLKAKLSQAQDELARASARYSDHEFDELRTQYDELRAQYDEIATRCKDAEAEVVKLNLRVDTLVTERARLDEELQRNGEEMEVATKSIDELDKVLTKTHQELCEARENNLAYCNELNELRSDNNHLQESMESLQGQYNELLSERDELNTRLTGLEHDKVVLNNSVTSLNSELRMATASCDQNKHEISNLENAIEQAEATIRNLRSENDALSTALNGQKALNEQEVSLLKQTHRDKLEMLKQENDKLLNTANRETENERMSHAETVGKLNEANQALASLDLQVLQLQKELDQCRATIGETDEKNAQRISELEAANSSFQKERTQLEKDLADAKHALVDLETTTNAQLDYHREKFESIKLEYTKFAERQNLEITHARSQTFELAEALDREKRWREERDAKILEMEELLMIRKEGFEKDIAELVNENCQLKQQIAEIKRSNDHLKYEVEQAQRLRKMLKDHEDSADQISMLSKNLANQSALLAQERQITRHLQNQIQELKGNIRIVARVRPCLTYKEPGLGVNSSPKLMKMTLTSSEILLHATSSTAMGGERLTESKFQYDRVFGPEAPNSAICEETEYLLQSALDGKQACILAYGQTGSGKTFTMGGRDGISSYAITNIMDAVKSKSGRYSVNIEAIEIYNNQMRDLLSVPVRMASATHTTTSLTCLHAPKLSLKQDPKTGIPELIGAARINVTSAAEALNAMNRAVANRSVAATACNEHSSRSHFIFTIYITREREIPGFPPVCGRLHLVDLAGSERANHAKTSGARFTESTAINQSLSSLGNVIHALINKTANAHISYRDNPLTHLLQGALSKNAKTMLLITLSPELASAEETRSTLRFADLASRAILK